MSSTDDLSDTRTFLFTDIVSSTRLWDAPESMGPALRLHDEIVREVLEREGGHVFSATGDGFGVAFERPDAAVRAAVEVQRRLGETTWPDAAEITVRIGLHLGRAEERGGNYFGPPVNRAARLMAIAEGRQIVLSATVREAVDAHVEPDVTFVPLGTLELRDVTEPIEAWSVAADGVEVAAPPERSTVGAIGNLPERVATLIGRSAEVAAVAAALDAHRLVTLVGVGGVGKTTLAADVARRTTFPDGAWLVKLGQIDDGRAVPAAIADALGLSAPGLTTDELIGNVLRDRGLLLLIDNCEHVREAVATAVEAVLDGTPNVRVLATSREPLRVAGERVVAIAPLGTRSSKRRHSDAVELFLRRAAERGAVIDPATQLTAVDELCRRLDGLPLAIELAAAKARAFDPARLVGLLDRRFQLLGGGLRSADARHQTLRATFGWSYELLEERDRLAFDRLGVMAGRFDLDDAVALCADVLDEAGVIASLASLVDKSLVQRHASAPPYRMLESLREFAVEQLVADGSADDARRRHATRLRDLAAELRRTFMGPSERAVAEQIAAQVNDFEAAVRWSAANGELDQALEIVVDLNTIGFQRGWRKAPTWLDDVLRDPPAELPPSWADFLAAASVTAVNEMGAVKRAKQLADAALAIDPDLPQALIVHAHLARSPQECHDLARRARDAAIERGELHWELNAITYQAFGASMGGDTSEALGLARELRRRGEEIGDRSTVGWSRYVVARALSSTDPARALAALDEAREIADQLANPNLEISARRHRAATLIASGDPDAAEESLRRLIARCLELGEVDNARRTCALAGITRAMRGDDETAALLIGRLGLPHRTAADLELYRRVAGELSGRLGARYELLIERGRSLSIPKVIDLTLASLEAANPAA